MPTRDQLYKELFTLYMYEPGFKGNFQKSFDEAIKENYSKLRKNLTPDELEKAVAIILKSSIIDGNVIFIDLLKEKMSEVYQKVFDGLDISEKEMINKFSRYEDHEFFTKIMHQFTEFGNINKDGGLLTMTETNKRKKEYNVNPTILSYDASHNEFEEYLLTIKDTNKLPIHEKFVISGVHWISGEISIGEDGNPKILFIDSMGQKSYEEEEWLLRHIKVFANTFLNGEIYVDLTQRQSSMRGCSTFALDDVRHLFTINKYLPDVYDKDLFKYLAMNVLTTEGNIHSVHLPISFMRTMQSSLLFRRKNGNPGEPDKPAITDFYDETQLTKPLGKGKPIAKEFTDTLKQVDNFIDKHGHYTKQNTRLQEKLDKMRNNVLEYLLKTPVSEVKQAMHEFTLDKFKERMTTKEERRSRDRRF